MSLAPDHSGSASVASEFDARVTSFRSKLLNRSLRLMAVFVALHLPFTVVDSFQTKAFHEIGLMLLVAAGLYLLSRGKRHFQLRALPLMLALVVVVPMSFSKGLTSGAVSGAVSMMVLVWLLYGWRAGIAGLIYTAASVALSAWGFQAGWFETQPIHDPHMVHNWIREGLALFLALGLMAIGGATWLQELRAFAKEQHETVEDLREQVAAREAAERNLTRAQKLQAVSHVASGVAHDFNNVLTVVMGEATLLEEDASSESERQSAAHIREAAEHAAALTRQLLMFAREDFGGIQAVDLARQLDAALRLARPVLPPRIELRTQFASPLPHVMANPTQLQQVVLNLILNARDAMERGTIEVGAQPVEGGALVRVIDQGHGIAKEHLQRIFEPFFTTKPPGRGTGLGLATVKDLTESWGGEVRVESTLGEGTCFSLSLAASREEASDEAPAILGAVRGGRNRVLVVDDDPPVRRTVAKMLRAADFDVQEAESGEAAWELLERGTVDVVLSDVMMPGVSGPELAAAMREHWPEVIVIVMSGFGDAVNREQLEALDIEVLRKPFEQADLLNAISARLSQRAG